MRHRAFFKYLNPPLPRPIAHSILIRYQFSDTHSNVHINKLHLFAHHQPTMRVTIVIIASVLSAVIAAPTWLSGWYSCCRNLLTSGNAMVRLALTSSKLAVEIGANGV